MRHVTVPNFVVIGQTIAEIMVIFRFFHLGFVMRVLITHEGHLVVFITVHNLIGIDAEVSILCTF